jgi:hypothetical protein
MLIVMISNFSSSEINLSLPFPVTRAKAKRIRRLNGKIRQVLWDLDYCFDAAEHWDDLSPVQKILLEEYSTDKLLELIELYNHHVSHSIHYRLREKTPEEEEEDAF